MDGSTGFECPPGTDPAYQEPSLVCTTPTPHRGQNDYCCISVTTLNPSCYPDDGLTCPAAEYGYVCPHGDVPSARLWSCGAPTPDPNGVQDDFCCTVHLTADPRCSVDAGACPGGATSFACPAGTDPGVATLACSTPMLDGGVGSYCCISTPGASATSTCVGDDTRTDVCPTPGTYPFLCVQGNPPSLFNPALVCSAPVPDADGLHTDYCCTLP